MTDHQMQERSDDLFLVKSFEEFCFIKKKLNREEQNHLSSLAPMLPMGHRINWLSTQLDPRAAGLAAGWEKNAA